MSMYLGYARWEEPLGARPEEKQSLSPHYQMDSISEPGNEGPESSVHSHCCLDDIVTGGKGAGLQQCNLALQLLSKGERKEGKKRKKKKRKSRSLTISLHGKYLVTNNHPELEFNKYSLCPTVPWSIIAFKNKSCVLEAADTQTHSDGQTSAQTPH